MDEVGFTAELEMDGIGAHTTCVWVGCGEVGFTGAHTTFVVVGWGWEK